jgi:hypothetical protein
MSVVTRSDRDRRRANSMLEIKHTIVWHEGHPPGTHKWRLLLIASPTGGNFDAAADNRPDLYVGHFNGSTDGYVPARVSGMKADDARPTLNVKYWAEINLPEGMEIRSLTVDDVRG